MEINRRVTIQNIEWIEVGESGEGVREKEAGSRW